MPRRSAGCGTCRRRKVLCDYGRPFCRNCIDRSRECLGYRPAVDLPGHKFHDQTNKTVAKSEGTTAVRGLQSKAGRSISPASPHTQAATWHHPRSIRSLFIDSTPVDRTQLLSRFLDMTFPDGSSNYLPAEYEWLRLLPTMVPRGEPLPAAISALCSVHLGTTMKDSRLLKASQTQYTTALQQLSMAVARPKESDYEETFTAIMLLTLCELFHVIAEDGTGWESHVRGAGIFLQLHGPSAINSPLRRMLLDNARLSSIYLGELKREAIFLDHHNWLDVTCQEAASNSLTALVNVWVGVPALMDRCMKTVLSDDIRDVKKVLHEAEDLQRQLSFWFDTHLRLSGFKYACCSDFKDFHLDGIFPVVFSFPDPRTGCLHLSNWTARLNIARAVCDMIRAYRSGPSGDILIGEAKSAEAELLLCATKVCQCIPFCCESGPGSLSRINGLLSLVVAYEAFDASGYREQSAWCERAFRNIRSSGIVQPGPFPKYKPPSLKHKDSSLELRVEVTEMFLGS